MIMLLFYFIFLVICSALFQVSAESSGKRPKREPVHGRKGVPKFYCPEGYNLEGGNMCSQEFISSPVEVCLNGELIAPGECLLSTKPIITCPSGYQQAGEKSHSFHGFGENACTSVQIAQMISECPPNSVSTNNKCIITKEAEIQMVCPLSEKAKRYDRASDCVQFDNVAPIPYCANGGKLDGGFCAAVQKVQCPSKKLSLSLLKGNNAVLPNSHIKQGRALAQRFKKNNAITLCEKPIRAAPNFKCPPGANENAGRHGRKEIHCVIPRVVPLLPICPFPGGITTPDGAFCTTNVTVEKLAVCPAGFSQCMENKSIYSLQQSFSGKCCRVDVVSPVSACPPDFRLEHGGCISYVPSVFKCHGKDVLLEENCVGRDIVPAMVELVSAVAPPKKS